MEGHSVDILLKNSKAKFWTYQEMFLYTAWSMGLQPGDTVHRKELFAFVQTRISNKCEESLQKQIETDSEHWEKLGSGLYKLTNRGFDEMIKKFGKPLEIPVRPNFYVLAKEINNILVTIIIEKNNPSTEILLDEKNVSGIEAYEYILQHGATIPYRSRSYVSMIWNWIVYDNDYYING